MFILCPGYSIIHWIFLLTKTSPEGRRHKEIHYQWIIYNNDTIYVGSLQLKVLWIKQWIFLYFLCFLISKYAYGDESTLLIYDDRFPKTFCCPVEPLCVLLRGCLDLSYYPTGYYNPVDRYSVLVGSISFVWCMWKYHMEKTNLSKVVGVNTTQAHGTYLRWIFSTYRSNPLVSHFMYLFLIFLAYLRVFFVAILCYLLYD